ncbi:flavin reductase [Actinoplanes sp. ATCC 53533]|uniref:NAD(P)-dependent oxidoreductase n=1 Tax=Actinoplanes sp. ATCC 53533 TaxID=1288362 RepID=UPI000F7839E1|nr:NAD(P)-binding oxidoreductase [Actinoplanes sp. ATCC 53533]RSM69542.1 flavin reductase [Actinoplanes sp. ATCC 53533]
MRIAVLGATGATGRLMVTAALDRGLPVTALARHPERVPVLPGLTAVAADVHDPESIAHAVAGCDVLLSGLGATKGLTAGTLTAGARAVVASGIDRSIWLGALGTGPSAAAAGMLTRTMLGVFLRNELPDKVEADATIIAAGGTVFHLGPMNDGPVSPARRTLTVDLAPKRLFPGAVSRATAAAAMVEEAVREQFGGQTVTVVSG